VPRRREPRWGVAAERRGARRAPPLGRRRQPAPVPPTGGGGGGEENTRRRRGDGDARRGPPSCGEGERAGRPAEGGGEDPPLSSGGGGLTTRLLSGGRAGCGDAGWVSGAGSASGSGSGSGVKRGGETSSNSSSPLPRGLISLKMRRRRLSRVRGGAMGERLRVAVGQATARFFGLSTARPYVFSHEIKLFSVEFLYDFCKNYSVSKEVVGTNAYEILSSS
jgi:hypothetical protein